MVQIRTRKFAFEIYWPLSRHIWLSNKFPAKEQRGFLPFLAIINYFFAFFPDELRPPSKDLPELLPTVHPNSVLPYHPEDLDYEDYVYEEYEDEKDEVTKSYFKVFIH